MYINLYMYSFVTCTVVYPYTCRHHLLLHNPVPSIYVPRTNFKKGTTMLLSGGYQIHVLTLKKVQVNYYIYI